MPNKPKILRTTVVLPKNLDQHLSLMAVMGDTTKNRVMTTGLEEFVKVRGLDPHKPPKITIKSG